MQNKIKYDLQGKRILVTGASSGIGESTVHLLSEAGAVVGIHYNQRLKEAQNIKEKIQSSGGVAEVFQANLSNAKQRARLIPAFIERIGGIDGLVNNAGAPQGKHTFPDILKTEWDETFALNIEAPFFLAQQAFTAMQSHGSGKIVNVSSIGVKYGGSAKTIHYAMAKSALETLTVGMAKMGAEFNILVNTVRAGMTDTAFWQDKTNEEIEVRTKMIPLKRIGKPEEVAEMICFLLSHAYITGQTIAVSGGE